MKIHYLEIVTPEAGSICRAYESALGMSFGAPDPMLGGARTAALPTGGTLGVRAPMHESEQPTTRPYWLVDDIEAAVAAAVESGAEIAHPPLEIPGKGSFAILFQGGTQYGLWQH